MRPVWLCAKRTAQVYRAPRARTLSDAGEYYQVASLAGQSGTSDKHLATGVLYQKTAVPGVDVQLNAS